MFPRMLHNVTLLLKVGVIVAVAAGCAAKRKSWHGFLEPRWNRLERIRCWFALNPMSYSKLTR